jgi:hypothetical protein
MSIRPTGHLRLSWSPILKILPRYVPPNDATEGRTNAQFFKQTDEKLSAIKSLPND